MEGLNKPPSVEGWDVHEVLGTGAFGSVFRATRQGNEAEEVALKFSSFRNEVVKKCAVNEAKVLGCCDSPHIVKMMAAEVEVQGGLVVFLELLQCELLQDLSREKFYTEEDARGLLLQVAQAVHYLHERSIAHCDLKIENIMNMFCLRI